MLLNRQKIKLVGAITLLLVTGFLITSFTSYFASRSSLRSEISHNSLPLTSDNIYSEIQRDLLRPVFISSLMATDTFLRDWVIDGENDETQITKYLNEIQTRHNTVTSFFVSEISGNYYHTNGILKKVSPDSPRDTWYYRVKAMQDDYEINIDADMANKDAMTIFINYKVFDYDKSYIGAAGVGLTVNAVKDLIESYQQKYNRTIYFIDKSGTVKLAGSQFDSTIKNIGQFEHADAFKEKLGSQAEHFFSYKKDGKLFHTNIRYIEEFDWQLVVEQPEQETLHQVFTTLLLNLAICVTITIITLLLVNVSVTAYQRRIETLRGIVPICSFCKQIRDDQGYWNKVEAYVSKHTDAQFSHSICPECAEEHYPKEYAMLKKQEAAQKEELS